MLKIRWKTQKPFQRLLLGLLLFVTVTQCNNPFSPAPDETVVDLEASTPILAPENRPPDLLDEVEARGYIKVGVRVWPDAVFQPALFRSPLAGLEGYEVDLAWAIANGLGVELEMAESDPRRLAGGNWAGEWDIALAWLPITDNAQQSLIFSAPYAYDAGQIAVHEDNASITGLNSLAGKKVGLPAFTLYQQILSGQSLSLDGQYISGSLPSDMEVVTYIRDGNALRDLAEGDGVQLDAALHSRLVLKSAIRHDLPIKIVSAPLFQTPIGVAFDRHGPSSERLRIKIDEILARLHEEGIQLESALKWYEEDITKAPEGD